MLATLPNLTVCTRGIRACKGEKASFLLGRVRPLHLVYREGRRFDPVTAHHAIRNNSEATDEQPFVGFDPVTAHRSIHSLAIDALGSGAMRLLLSPRLMSAGLRACASREQ